MEAVPDVGYEFTGWSGDLSGSINPDLLIMYGDRTITANFEIEATGILLNVQDASGAPGDADVIISVNISDIGQEEIYGVELTLNYDPALLQVVSGEAGAIVPVADQWQVAINTTVEGKVGFQTLFFPFNPSLPRVPLPSEGGEIVKIHFSIKDTATAGVTQVSISEAAGEKPNANEIFIERIDNGQLTIQ